MDILTVSDFDALPYNVPGKYLEDDATFTEYMNKIIAKELKKLLGLTLYDLFVAGTEDAEEYTDAKWKNLINGARYEFEGVEYEWAGFTEALKGCVYALHLRDRYDNDDENGVSVSKQENATAISPALRIVNGYNAYVNLIGNCEEPKNTFYGFMVVNKEAVYPTWVFTAPKRINRFNL